MKNLKILILLFFIIASLSFVSYYRFRDFEKFLPEIKVPKIEIPEIKIPEIKDLPAEFPHFQEKQGCQEFISPDGKLTLQYPAAWMKIDEKFLQPIGQEMLKETEILLFAQRIKLEKAVFASLMVQELKLEKQEGIEEVIEKIKNQAKEQKTEMEIISLEIKDRGALLMAKYRKQGHPVFHSKTKILLGENKAFLIVFMALEKHWPKFEKEAKDIFGSISLDKQ